MSDALSYIASMVALESFAIPYPLCPANRLHPCLPTSPSAAALFLVAAFGDDGYPDFLIGTATREWLYSSADRGGAESGPLPARESSERPDRAPGQRR